MSTTSDSDTIETASTLESPRCGPRSTLKSLIVIVAGCLLVYSQVPQLGWLTWDDRLHVPANPGLNPPTWQSLGQFWSEPYFSHYVPVSYTFWAGEVWLSRFLFSGPPAQLSPALFHVGSLLLHVVCACLVFFLLRRLVSAMGLRWSVVVSFASAGRAVAWISETRTTLAGVWMLLALLSHVRTGDEFEFVGTSDTYRRRRVVGWFVVAWACCTLAILSKPSAVALPVVAWVIDRFWLERTWRFSLFTLAPWLLPAFAVILITSDVQAGAARVADAVAPGWRPLIALDALWFYLNKLVIPWPLSTDYGRTPQYVIQTKLIFFTPWIPLLVLLTLWYSLDRRWWLAPVGISIAALLPMLGLMPFGFQEISTVADRYMYLALLGPALALALVLKDGSRRRACLRGAAMWVRSACCIFPVGE